MTDRPDIDEVADTLVTNGAVYVAADTQSLVDEPAQLYYHLPPGSDAQEEAIATYLADEVGHRPRDQQVGGVRIADRLLPTVVSHVLHGELHLHRRVPIYVAESIPGLEPVSIEDGIERVTATVTGEVEPAPQHVKEVPLEDLLENLAAAGAASVELARERLVMADRPIIDLRIPIVPAEGAPIVGPIESVEVNGECYPVRTTLTLEGPYGTDAWWRALYVADDVHSLQPLPVETGIEAAEKLIEHAERCESLRELESAVDFDPRLRE